MAAGFSITDALNKNSKAGINEAPRARFRTKDISIFKIYSNSMNFYPQEGIEKKAGEILMVGLLENLVVKYAPCEKGDFELISGERRWRALKLLVEKGYKEFELATCQVRSPRNKHEEKIELILANSSRTKKVAVMIQEEQELKEELEYMKVNKLELKGYDLQSGRLRDVIATMLHMSKTKVAQIEAVSNKLIPEWKEELKKERLTFSAAYELSKVPVEGQQEALKKFMESGELTHKDIKGMKEKKAAGEENAVGETTAADEESTQIESLEEFDNVQQSGKDEAGETVSDSDTGNELTISGNTDTAEEQDAAGEEYETPHPEEKTFFSCPEEQNATEEENGQKIHKIKLSFVHFDDVYTGKKAFEIRKNDEVHKEGDILEIMETKANRYTGRTIRVRVTYVLEDEIGLEEGYCIIAFRKEDGEKF